LLASDNMPRKKYINIPTEEETWNRIDAMVKSLGIKKTLFMKEIVDALWDASSQYIGRTVMLVDVRNNQALFTFSGKSALTSGTFQMPMSASEKEVDKMVKQKIESQINEEKKNAK
jgi:hypothetical protein